MFGFEKLLVYQKAKSFNSDVRILLTQNKAIDNVTNNQLRRAALSVMLNIAEGSSRFSKRDRRNFLIISRGSLIECVAIFDFMSTDGIINDELFNSFYQKCEELSKMLYAMIKNLE